MEINPSIPVQLITCTLGCVGFAILFHARGKALLWNAVGAFLTWVLYLCVCRFWPSGFAATASAATFVAAYAQIMARVCRQPATVFLTASIFPVIPGAHLYEMMYDLVMQETGAALAELQTLLLACLAIILGFFIVEVFNKYLTLLLRARRIRQGCEEPELPYWGR